MVKQHSLAFSEAQLSLIPELRYFVDGQMPAEDLEAYFRFQRGWPTIVTVLTGVLLAPAVTLLLHRGLGVGIILTITVAIAMQLFISWALLGMVFPAVRRRRIRAALRLRLLASGIRACAVCAYDMRSSPAQCPECGAPAEAAEAAEGRDGSMDGEQAEQRRP